MSGRCNEAGAAIGIGSPPQTMRQRSATMNEMPSVTSTCPRAFPASGRRMNRSTNPPNAATIAAEERNPHCPTPLPEGVSRQWTQDEPLDQSAKRGNHESAEQCGKPEVWHDLEYRDAQVRTEHEQRAVGHIRDAHQPKDQREPCR